ncbi:MAG: hypothetical protein JNM79_01915 [Burkholderiales bacterium]|nr:hypothetical protein [Burkholderiales bacterium]
MIRPIRASVLVLSLVAAGLTSGVYAQSPAASSGAMTPSVAPAAPSASASKRRALPRVSAPDCPRLADPWDNLCQIRKMAEVACSDISAPPKPRPVSRRKNAPPPAAVPNERQNCVDAYMRNV